MYIKELEVDNFKSFANNVTIPFRKGFTTIAGPNGSGKSNIIDSILFALGLASARNLRMEQLSDFISTHTKKNEAYVKVVLEGENENEEELSIARKIRKSSQGYNSVYYMNDKVTTQTEILARLEKYRITPNSYNVVMQSDVMSITNCSNGERRKIIDELAGIGDFNRRIDKAKGELETVEERVQNANLILGEIESVIEELAQQKETAIKYQQLKTEKTGYESQITTVKYFDLKRNLELAHQNILEFNKKKKEEEANLSKLEKELEEIKKKYDEAEALVKKNGEAEQIETKKRLVDIQGLISNKNFAISSVEKNIHDNLKTIENTKNGNDKCVERIAESKLKIEEKKKEIENINSIIKEKEAELSKILEEVSGLNKNADKQLEERNKLKTELEKLKEEEWGIKSSSMPLETELSVAKKEIENAKKTIESLNNFKANYTDNKDKLSLQVEALTKEVEDFKFAQQNVSLQLDTNKNEISDLMYDIQTVQKKLVSLEAKKNALEEMGLGRNIDALMSAEIQGVHAPLLQLGSVENEYETALEVAMGGRMRNIVVDDDETAKQCINYLKSARLPALTFLPLNKMRKAPNNLRLPKDKGVIDFAINLLDFDDKYIDAFYYALADTLIVEDFDCARKLIGQYRIVTLDGSLFEKGGAITGGDRRNSTLKFSQKQDEELERYKQRYNELITKQKELELKAKNLDDRQQKLRQGYSNSMTALNSAKIELNNLNNNAKFNEEKINQANIIIKDNEPKIQNIEKKLEKTEEKLIALNDKMLILQDKIKEIESKMSEGELKKLKEMTSGIENEIRKLQNKINNCNNEIISFEHDCNFQNNIIETNEEQIKKLLKSNDILANDKLQFTQDIKDLQVKEKELEEVIKTLGEKLVELQTKRDKIRDELLEGERRKTNKGNEIDRIAEQVEAFKSRRRELEPQLDEVIKELKEKDIDVKTLTPTTISIDEINAKIQRLQKKMDEIGAVNMLAIDAYDEKKARQEEIQGQITTLSTERKDLLEKMNGYEKDKKDAFMRTYDNINENFKTIFTTLTEGEGELMLDNPESPFEGGLTIKAQVRDKTKQKLSAMSGGEKSLTALAFVFAIQKYLPAPFYALDEVDASLDGINVDRLTDMIQKQAKDTQFIVVSHKKHVLDLSDRTIGVTQKEKGKTHVTGIAH